MVYGTQKAAKRPGYPSGNWHADRALSGDFRQKLTYLWHQPQMRFWCIFLAILASPALLLLPALILQPREPGAHPTVREIRELARAILMVLALAVTLYSLVKGGRPVEGLIVGVTDDGIDRLYTVYYEDGGESFELQFTGKCKKPAGKLQAGDSITLMLGKPPNKGLYGQGLGPKQIVVVPTVRAASSQSDNKAA